jgi:hypothetical protein
MRISGSPVPESGAAVRQLVSLHDFGVEQRLGWVAGTVLGPPFALVKQWRHGLGGLGGAVLFAAAVVVLLAVAIRWVTRRDAPGAGTAGAGAGAAAASLPVFLILLMFFYSLYLGALWFSTRYLAPAGAVITLVLAVLIGRLSATTGSRRPAAPIAAACLLLLVLGGLGVAAVRDVQLLRAHPAQTADTGLDGAKGYREVARAILQAAPPGAVIGSLQSGALSYYAPPDRRVVNLDGVVNSEAGRAVRTHDVAAFARSEHVSYFADWGYNRAVLSIIAGRQLTPGSFREVARAKAQGGDVFTLWRVTWPAA